MGLIKQGFNLVAFHQAILAVLDQQVNLDGNASETVDAFALKHAGVGQCHTFDLESSPVAAKTIPHGMYELVILVPLNDWLRIANDWAVELDYIVFFCYIFFSVAVFHKRRA